jgi:hypothetical protein
MVEVACPFCFELHTHTVGPGWAGELLFAPCRLGSYRAKLG